MWTANSEVSLRHGSTVTQEGTILTQFLINESVRINDSE